MDGRLDRRARSPPPQGVQAKIESARVPDARAKEVSLKKSPSTGSVGAVCAAWIEAHQASRDKYPAAALATLAGSGTIHQLTPLHFQALIATWKQNLSRTSLYLYRGGLVKLAKHLAAISGRTDLPGQVPRVPVPPPRKVIAEPAEVLQLLAAAKPWLRCAILFAAHTALRRSDILRAAPIHYNAETRTLSIDQKKPEAW